MAKQIITTRGGRTVLSEETITETAANPGGQVVTENVVTQQMIPMRKRTRYEQHQFPDDDDEGLSPEAKLARDVMHETIVSPEKLAEWYEGMCGINEWWCKHQAKTPMNILNSDDSISWVSALECVSRYTNANEFKFANNIVFALFTKDMHLLKSLDGMYGCRFLRKNAMRYFYECGNHKMVEILASSRMSAMEVYRKASDHLKFVPNCRTQ